MTCLLYAIKYHNYQLIKLLFDYGAGSTHNHNIHSKELLTYNTALHYAIINYINHSNNNNNIKYCNNNIINEDINIIKDLLMKNIRTYIRNKVSYIILF